MPKRKTPELPPKEQLRRFREAAKKAELTKDEEVLEESFKKIAKQKSATKGTTP